MDGGDGAGSGDRALRTLAALNACWLEGRPDELASFLHEDVTMVFPAFAGEARGREAVLDGFRSFGREAEILEYAESEHRADVAGGAGVVSYRFDMTYRRGDGTWRSSGRDLWVLIREGEAWRAVWRTMLDVAEEAVHGG